MIEQDGIRWIEIGQAARMSRTKAAVIRDAVGAGSIPSIHLDGKTLIPLTAANRLKREASLMISVQRKTRIGDTLPPAGARPGPHAAREKQDVLPISSGREGRGWKGQPDRS